MRSGREVGALVTQGMCTSLPVPRMQGWAPGGMRCPKCCLPAGGRPLGRSALPGDWERPAGGRSDSEKRPEAAGAPQAASPWLICTPLAKRVPARFDPAHRGLDQASPSLPEPRRGGRAGTWALPRCPVPVTHHSWSTHCGLGPTLGSDDSDDSVTHPGC